MRDWKNLFREHILIRGEMYFYEGAVQECHKTEYGYHAVVEGTEDYEVDIEVKGEQIQKMYCSCPFAEDGNHCKHMAAVLFEIEEQYKEEILSKNDESGGKERELEEIIENIPEAELRSVIKMLAEQNDESRDMLIARYASAIDETQMYRLKQGVDRFVWQYSDRAGYIDYRNAWDFACAMTDYLYDTVRVLMERSCCRQAFELTNYVFQTAGNSDIDDSDGSILQIVNACYDTWKNILEKCTDDEKNEMFSWFMNYLSGNYAADYMEEYIEDFLAHEFRSREMLEKKLKYLDDMIEKQASSTDCGSIWSVHYGCENNIMKRLKLMKELELPEDEIREYLRKHWNFSAVRKLEIKEKLECGELEEAIQILCESKLLDRAYPGLVAHYSEQLISIYEMQSDNKACKEELMYYVFECPQTELVYIYKLKELCTDAEWNEYREQILQNPKNHSIFYPFMESEKMYERMLECLKKEEFIFNMDRYEKIMKEKFPEQVRDIYVAYLYREAKRANDRKRYRELMRYLKKLRKYPDGKEKAAEIAENWRSVYYRRSAMMDEMRKAGFN